MYEKAILSAARTDFAQVKALASECAEWYLVCIGMSDKASSYFRRCRECCAKWGAKAKVMQLEDTFDFDCGDAEEESRLETKMTPKAQRFDGRASREHKKLDVTRRKSSASIT